MDRRLLTRKTSLLIAIALAVTYWCQPAAAYTLTVRAWIDGDSQLIIQGDTVQWKNLTWTVPGMEPVVDNGPSPNYPTTLTTADMGAIDWYPVWPGGIIFSGPPGNTPPPTELLSMPFINLNLAMAAVDQPGVGLTIIEERAAPQNNWVHILEYPSFANDYKLIVDFNDNNAGGAAWYTVRLEYTAVPLPPSALLLGSGLLGLVGWRKLRKV